MKSELFIKRIPTTDRLLFAPAERSGGAGRRGGGRNARAALASEKFLLATIY